MVVRTWYEQWIIVRCLSPSEVAFFLFSPPLWLRGRKLSAGSLPEGVCVCVFCSEGCFVETASWIVDSFPHSAPMRPTHRKLVLLNTADPPPLPLLHRQVCTLWAGQRNDSESLLPFPSRPLLANLPPLCSCSVLTSLRFRVSLEPSMFQDHIVPSVNIADREVTLKRQLGHSVKRGRNGLRSRRTRFITAFTGCRCGLGCSLPLG